MRFAAILAAFQAGNLTVWAQGDQQQQPQEPFTLEERVNLEFSLTESQVVSLAIDPVPGMAATVAVPLNDRVMTLVLTPRSARSAEYQVLAQIADGSLVPVQPGVIRTLRGALAEAPGSKAAASMMFDGLHATIVMPDGQRFWLEPIVDRIEGAQANQYVIYRADAVVCPPGVCGVNDALIHRDRGPVVEDGGIAGGVLSCAEMACDADVEYYQDHGSNVAMVEAQINNITNTMNLQYESEVNIRHEITTIIVRTAEPDPYTSTSAPTLLDEFRDEWLANQGGIPRDLAQLFTGKELIGGTIGIAWTIGGVCTAGGYCLVQSDFSGSFACKTDLSSHEVGHLWDATHCSCPSFTMNPTITCANQHEAGSITEITNYRNSVSCDTPCEDGTTTLPFFDDFPSTTINAALWTGIDGATVNTTGTSEPSPPNSLDLDGSSNGGDELRSAIIDASGFVDLKVEFFYQRKGGGDSPETGDDLLLEYLDDSNQWIEVHREFGSGADMTTYSFVSVLLPTGALHTNFRARFRAISSTVGSDDWFVDNVSITALVPPSNDECADAITIGLGSTPFTTVAATTSGPSETIDCNFNGSSLIGSDVWFRYVSNCNQQVTASVCGASFDTKVAAYQGLNCPTSANNTIACNDNFCGSASSVSFMAQSFIVYRIRIGGFNEAEGTGTLVLSCAPPPPTGACCLSDRTCLADLTQAQCIAAGGTYEGDDTFCDVGVCAATPPTGACCLGNGNCLNAQTSAECAGVGGIYQGDASACAGVNCPQPTGACCLANGSCLAAQTAAQCAGAGGAYQGDDLSCASVNCPQPTGACCLPNGTCLAAQTSVQCAGASGVYQGDDSSCGLVNCPQPTGACCLPTGACLVSQTAAECSTAGGVYQGDNVSCANVSCPAPCLPDISPPGGGDAQVNVDDLLTIINAWGPCPDPDNCPADIAPGEAGDDQVNVDDLLAVINAWGPC